MSTTGFKEPCKWCRELKYKWKHVPWIQKSSSYNSDLSKKLGWGGWGLKGTLRDSVLFKWQQSKLTTSNIDALHAESSVLWLPTLCRLWKDSNTPFRKYLKGYSTSAKIRDRKRSLYQTLQCYCQLTVLLRDNNLQSQQVFRVKENLAISAAKTK